MRAIDKDLFYAAIEFWKPGAFKQIRATLEQGADPNLICIDTSTERGPVTAGTTLLTYAIKEGSTRLTELLLEYGADPNLPDELGWTPWAASTLAFEKQDKLASLLKTHHALPKGAHLGPLARAIYEGDIEKTQAYFASAEDLQVLASFRVDLIAHQILNNQITMLNFLLEHNMPCDNSQLHQAVRQNSEAAVDCLLKHGHKPDREGDENTLLMLAASIGNEAIVRKLVAAGADVERYAFDNIEMTAAFSARRAGHKGLADWLQAQMSEAFLQRQAEFTKNRNPKFKRLYNNMTSAESLSTEQLVKTLEKWSEQYPFTITHATASTVSLSFSDDLSALEALIPSIIQLCPDLQEDQKALKKKLQKSGKVTLWWD